MSAFVPNAGVPLRRANSFVNGNQAVDVNNGLFNEQATKSSSSASTHGPVMMADGDGKKKGFSLPNVKLPSVKLPFGKKPAEGKVATVPPTPPPPPAKVQLKIAKASVSDKAPTIAKKSPPKNVRSFPKEYQFLVDSKIENKTTYDMRVIAPNYFYTEDKQGSKNQRFDDMDVYTDDSFWEYPGGWPREQANIAIDRCLQQLFGTSKLFKSDLKQLETSIICVKQTGNLKEFIREVGLSNLYRTRFFEPVSNLRFIELNFKHFLGRAPRNQAEVSEHVKIITQQGYEAEINSYIDSEEYETLYGFTRIPSVNFDTRFPYNQEMNKLALLNGAYATPDTLTKSAFFIDPNASSFPPFSIANGLPSGWKSLKKVQTQAVEEAQAEVSPLGDDTPLALAADELKYRMTFGTTQNFWYKDSIVYASRLAQMEPVLTHSPEEEAEAEAILKYGSNMGKMFVGQK